MTNEEKANELGFKFFPNEENIWARNNVEATKCAFACLGMAQWKDEQYKTAYVVTRSDLHYDEVEKVFFDKSKAEEYCKSYNEDENSYHRDITKIEVSL